jgi:voltage-gated potassium channel
LALVIRRFLANLLAAGGSSRVTRGGIALLAMLVVGSTGYVVIEGWSVFDAAYMTVVTMTTVGYGEVRPLSQAGRAFNLFVMIGGVGLMLYILTMTVQAVVEDEVLKGLFRRRRMRAMLEALEQHYILCGYGRVGREVAAVFRDSDNVVITLTASAINPELNIVARADDAETTEKLTMAGAGRVVTPYRIGGRRMALSAIRPMAVDFFDDIVDPARAGPSISEIEIVAGSPLAGMTVGGFAAANDARVLALCRRDGTIMFTPDGATVMEPGDGAIILGTGGGADWAEGKGSG